MRRSDDLIRDRGLKAGTLVGTIAKELGGGGGGRPHLATAGAKDVSRLDEVLSLVSRHHRGGRVVKPGKVAAFIADAHRAGRPLFFLLIVPTRWTGRSWRNVCVFAAGNGVDAFLVGDSLALNADFAEAVHTVKTASDNPVIIFPAGYIR